jgi:acyl-CoA synthetase (AMP-forming)/AMP-acid ligase II
MLGDRFRGHLAAIGPQIRHVELSSSPMHADEKADLVALLPNAEINLGYGLTEATRSSHLSLNRDVEHLDSAGRPGFPGVEITIRDEAGAVLADGRVGEIVVTGGNVAQAYIIGREWVREPFEGGSFHTGDLGHLDGEGYLHVAGRMDDMINTGGHKLHPTEVERVLHEAFPDLDCAISQRPHPLLGARPVLCLGDADADAATILGLLHRACEAYKVPEEVVRLAAIPRTANGKVIRSELARSVNSLAGETEGTCPSAAP